MAPSENHLSDLLTSLNPTPSLNSLAAHLESEIDVPKWLPQEKRHIYRDAACSPGTLIAFTVIFTGAAEPLWNARCKTLHDLRNFFWEKALGHHGTGNWLSQLPWALHLPHLLCRRDSGDPCQPLASCDRFSPKVSTSSRVLQVLAFEQKGFGQRFSLYFS